MKLYDTKGKKNTQNKSMIFAVDHEDVSIMNISGLLLPTMTSDLWEAGLNMLMPALASFSQICS